MKRAIFGGSFDPPTKAHYDLAIELTKRFDEVIVVPAYISPFKAQGSEVDGQTRLSLLRELYAPFDKITVSDCEIEAQGTSYSYMTAERFYSKNDELYFVIGSDGLKSLDRWARVDILKSLVTFYVVERPFYPIEQEELDYARSFLRAEIAPFMGKEGSSSLLKVALAFNREDEVVPPLVADYIKKHGLYREYLAITDRYQEFKMKESRIAHTYRTAKSAIILANRNGADVEKTVKACLLHDIGKYFGQEDFERKGLIYPSEALRLPAPVAHQLTGAVIAKEEFGISDEEILSAIATHTTGAKNMSLIQKIVFVADYIEEGRAFDGLDEIRLIVSQNLDEGVKAVLKNTIKYLAEKGEKIAPETVEAYESYK